ncbi:hypothetical protein H0H81_007986 [Sphagnurus paluster]|uniref:Uncharacterized protein n=1 Tax=Sphagnurus paluster TaxID=117069 RepID=A0A9P7GRE5_9AGAR|nr:hypothetical protein H0H81_007986 [Sphagnurus paluster]
MEPDTNGAEANTKNPILENDPPQLNADNEELDPQDLRHREGSSGTGHAESCASTPTLDGSPPNNDFGFLSNHDSWRAMESERTTRLDQLRQALDVQIARRRRNITARREAHEAEDELQKEIGELGERMKILLEKQTRIEEERFSESEISELINARVEQLEREIKVVERNICAIREAENEFKADEGKEREA